MTTRWRSIQISKANAKGEYIHTCIECIIFYYFFANHSASKVSNVRSELCCSHWNNKGFNKQRFVVFKLLHLYSIHLVKHIFRVSFVFFFFIRGNSHHYGCWMIRLRFKYGSFRLCGTRWLGCEAASSIRAVVPESETTCSDRVRTDDCALYRLATYCTTYWAGCYFEHYNLCSEVIPNSNSWLDVSRLS